MLLLIYFIFLFFLYFKKKSVVSILIGLQILSLLLMYIIGYDYPIKSLTSLFNIFFTGLILSILILPWKDYCNIKEIYTLNEKKVLKLTKILMIISSIIFVTLFITSIYVLVFVENINSFKYSEGVLEDFMYHQLPIDVRFFLLSYYLYPLSYFLIPLHFYYLGKRNVHLSVLSFIMSLNIILYGLTFFSRWTIIHYILIYLTSWFLFKSSISIKYNKNLKIIFLSLSLVLVISFIAITSSRFETDISYENTLPSYSRIKDPTIFSYFDYLSQWYNNSMFVLDHYRFETYKGQATLSPILSILEQNRLVGFSSDKLLSLKMKLMPNNWYLFNGLVASWVYDFGYLLTFILSLFYYYIIHKLKPIQNRISLTNLFLLVLLIQIPLFSIFYSFLGGIMFPLLYWIPIFIFLKFRISKFQPTLT